MAAQGDKPTLGEKGLDVFEKTFYLLWSKETPHDLWHWIILISLISTVFFILLIVLFKTISAFLECTLKLADFYKNSGLPLFLNEKNKHSVRRRKQFCTVLESDLAYIAKAENWNDQYFTDLEAEVETEGGYYASALDKLRRKKSLGLRKERSLIRAIDTSTERAMQLVGEPGSGKSVALRHLAKQLAEKGKKSNDKDAHVPLYINLRELEVSKLQTINADTIREFVLDNIRRGDADTSAFVKENWEDYCNRGIWIFLFDSFDEIPAVLHSATGSNIIRLYSQAIRQFLEGMGECKGILASREFKGPEALPWKKVRILPLSGEKQDELIINSFMSKMNMNLVRNHLANAQSSIGSTPLFLTLLCRYVKDEGRAPTSDHDILLQHIERLAKREPEYLKKKYNLTPDELIYGAERLARLFAEDDNLSLAPSIDQIDSQLSPAQIPGGSIERLVSALVDTKIGRADVPNAPQGERRFAFSHRRYQEALFVRFLTKNPGAISDFELLTESRWREYSVTFLQTGSNEDIDSLLKHAIEILSEEAKVDNSIICGQAPLPSDLKYFDWSDNKISSLLSLLQEGLANRLNDIPNELSEAIFNILSPRWDYGDSWDRCEVLRLGGLLPHDVLVEYLSETFKSGTHLARANAFKQAAFTTHLPESVKSFVLEMLSSQVILANNREEELTIEALSSRLPKALGADIVVNRGRKLKSRIKWLRRFVPMLFVERYININLIITNILGLVDGKSRSKSKKRNNIDGILKDGFDLAFCFFIILTLWMGFLFSFIAKGSVTTIIYGFAMTSVIIVFYIIMFAPFLVRSQGYKVKFNQVCSWFLSRIKSRVFIKRTFMLIIFFSIFILVSLLVGYLVEFVGKDFMPEVFPELKDKEIIFHAALGIATIAILGYFFVTVTTIFFSVSIKKSNNDSFKELEAFKLLGGSDVEILYSAKNVRQLNIWLKRDDGLLSNTHSIRTFSSFVVSVLNKEKNTSDYVTPACFKKGQAKKGQGSINSQFGLKKIMEILETKLLNIK